MAEAIEHVSSIEAAALKLEGSPGDSVSIDTIFRGFHTIKGGAAFIGLGQIGRLAHAAEEIIQNARDGRLQLIGPAMDVLLEAADGVRCLVSGLDVVRSTGEVPEDDPRLHDLMSRLQRCGNLQAAAPQAAEPVKARLSESDPVASPPAAADSFVRIKTQRLDALMNLVGELVVAELMARESQEACRGDSVSAQRSAHLGRITRELYDLSVSMRMIPIRATFQKMARAARDMSRKMQKEIELKISGQETEVDRKIVETVSDPLMHMVRNAVDHGVESAEERIRAGKSRVGIIAIDARHEAGEIVIEIRDNGRGLDRQRILAAAQVAGLVAAGEEVRDPEVWGFVFHPGLSTAQDVTEISGRGVGMDVVKRNVEALRGRIEIESVPGAGTAFTVRLPLTLAVIDAFAVGVGSERYLLPTSSIEECVQPTAGQIVRAPGMPEMCLIRGKPIPLIRLGELFEIPANGSAQGDAIAVVVRDGQRRCCLLVDTLLGQHQVVLKSMGESIESVPGFSGGAVLGDGRIALVFDVPGLVRRCETNRRKTPSAARNTLAGVPG